MSSPCKYIQTKMINNVNYIYYVELFAFFTGAQYNGPKAKDHKMSGRFETFSEDRQQGRLFRT